MGNLIFLLMFFLIFLSIPGIYQVNAHSLFNSADELIGDYRVQIATLPEIPTTGGTSQILFRVLDIDGNEVERFTMGLRIFYDDVQIDSFPPKSHDEGHYEMDYVFENPGNHIFRVDLYDAGKDGGTLTYTFNISTHNPFGYIFIISIAAGGIGFAIIIGYIYLPKRLKSRTKS